MQSKAIVGVSALVYERGQEAYFGAFGLADRENDKPMARDTIVQIFSMTKPITGVALMKLYERGKFQLDEPLAKYLPEFANVRVYAGSDANGQPRLEAPKRADHHARHPAPHRGLRRDDADPAVGALYRAGDPREIATTRCRRVRAKLAAVPLLVSAGHALAVRSARSTCRPRSCRSSPACRSIEYLELHIFRPLGMTTTRYTILPTDADRPRLAAMYTRNDDGTFTRQPDEEAFKFNTRRLAATSRAASVSSPRSTTT